MKKTPKKAAPKQKKRTVTTTTNILLWRNVVDCKNPVLYEVVHEGAQLLIQTFDEQEYIVYREVNRETLLQVGRILIGPRWHFDGAASKPGALPMYMPVNVKRTVIEEYVV